MTMETNQFAAELFRQYRQQTEQQLLKYTQLKTQFPLHTFPDIAKIVWRTGVLAQAWGSVATKLTKGKINYLENWRQGI